MYVNSKNYVMFVFVSII